MPRALLQALTAALLDCAPNTCLPGMSGLMHGTMILLVDEHALSPALRSLVYVLKE